MRKRRIKTILSVIAIATMMLSSMGIGVFAEVEQTAPTVQAQANDESEPQDVQEPAAPAEEQNVEAKGGETPTIDPESAEVIVGKTVSLEAKYFGEGADIVWTSSDTEKKNVSLTVSDETKTKATVTGKEATEEGSPVTITATVGSGDEAVSATCTITVKDPGPEEYSANTGVTVIRTVSGHQRIKVVWSPVQVTKTQDGESVPVNANRYIVQRAQAGGTPVDYAVVDLYDNGAFKSVSGNAVSGPATSPYWTKEAAAAGVAGGQIYLEDKDVGDGIMDNATKQFRGGDWVYRVIPAYVDTDGSQACRASDGISSITAPDACMRTSCVALKIKVKKNLKSHDKQHAKLSLKKGTTIYTCAFGYGRYQFIHNGNFYWLNRVGTKSHKTVYDKWHPYTDEEVLYFANGRDDGLSASSTHKMVWVNTYTQRIYVFTGSYGNWSIDNPGGWYVSTGKPATPTIRYIDPKSPVLDTGRIVGKCKTINKKVKKRHGIPSWNCFSTWNAIHGQKKSWSIKGVPKSNGCVRNTNAHAKYIYNTCPKKTRVLIF